MQMQTSEMQQDKECRREREPTPWSPPVVTPSPDAHHDIYLQFLHPLVVVGYGGLKSLKEFLLRLQLVAHSSGPRVSLARVLGLAVVGEGRTLGARGLHAKHPILRVSVNLLLKLHFVHLQCRKCFSSCYLMLYAVVYL